MAHLHSRAPKPDPRTAGAPDPGRNPALFFPEEEEMPEGYDHLVVRTFLFRLLRYALPPDHTVGSDQFVYWVANDPKVKLSPDVFVRLNAPKKSFSAWKTWEQGGAPHLAVEIVSPNEGDGVDWDVKLASYHALGVEELVRFDPHGPAAQRLRVWDRVRNDLIERQISRDKTQCLTLGSFWTVRPVEDEIVGLRLVDDEGRLIETHEEAEARARAAAEVRVRELEAEIVRLTRGSP